MGKKLRALLDGHPAHLRDVLSINEDVARFTPQPRAVAFRADRVSAIAAQEYANVQLVFFRFEIVEKLTDRVQRESAFVGVEVAEWDIQTNAAALGGFPEVVEVSSISRLGPGIDRAL